jgi:twitching motility protein PilI
MARKSSLRDFQSYLSARLSDAAQGQGASSWLGLDVGGEPWLIGLSDGGEIVQAPQLLPVPLTHSWFAGVANVRGNLYAVTDFAAFLGGRGVQVNANARLLLVGARHGSNAALLVPRMLGLRKPELFKNLPDEESAPAWGRQRYVDADGKIWKKLLVRELLVDRDFMNVGL